MRIGAVVNDPYLMLRRLYLALLSSAERFDEFARLLALYENASPEREPPAAAVVRSLINERIRAWTELAEAELGVSEVLQWRQIVVEGKTDGLSVSLTPEARWDVS